MGNIVIIEERQVEKGVSKNGAQGFRGSPLT